MKKLYIILVSLTLLLTLGFNQEVQATYGGLNETKTVTNLIDNGDISDDSNADGLADKFLSYQLESYSIVNEVQIFNGDDVLTSFLYYNDTTFITYEDHYYYNSFDSININTVYTIAGNNIIFYDGISDGFNSQIIKANGDYNGISNRFYNNDNTIDSNLDNFIIIDLTVEFGSGNEPTIEEFEVMLENAPDYFETFTFNYNEPTSSAIAVNAEYNVDNLIINGDFETDTNWTYIGLSNYDINSGNLYNIDTTFSGIQQFDINFLITNKYYLSFDVIDYINGSGTTNVFSIDIINNGFYSIVDNPSLDEATFYFKRSISPVDLNVDNINLFNLSSYYGLGNEPDLSQFESKIDLTVWADTYTYEDDAYMIISQNNPIYQYYNNQDTGETASIDLVLEDSIEGLLEVEPTIIIYKYDLDMNYEGLIFEGNITDETDVDLDDKLEHNFSYNLPEPTATEEGYIYVAYDVDGGNILGGGYVYGLTGVSFNDAYSGIRTQHTAIGINSSPYSELSYTDVLFDPTDYSSYIHNDTDSIITVHYKYEGNDILDEAVMYLFSENTDQVETLSLLNVYDTYSDKNLSGDFVYEGIFHLSINDDLPPLLDYLNTNSVTYLDMYNSWLFDYNYYYTNIFYNAGYAENKGVYTYAIVDSVDDEVVVIGESPIYYIESFNTFNLPRHITKAGNPFTAEINLEDTLLISESYDYQYIYDTNTNVYTAIPDLEITTVQSLYIEIFEGLSDTGGNLRYYMTRGSIDYNNGANYDTYDIYIEDSYEMTVNRSLEEITDTFFTDLGINDTLGKMLVTFVVVIALGVLIYVKSRNYIATLIVVFIVLGLAFVLGFIEAWIILIIIMVFSLLAWYVFKNTTI